MKRMISLIAILTVCAVIILAAIRLRPLSPIPDALQARQRVTEMEDRMRSASTAVHPADLMEFFAPDDAASDRAQRATVLAEVASATSYAFTLTAFAVIDTACDTETCTVTVRETRVYDQAAGRFGNQFDRDFIVEPDGNSLRIRAYQHLSRGNAYVGGLSGSEKYSGFYP